MPKNLRALAKPRANKWATIDEGSLNALGRRLVRLLSRDRASGGTGSPSDFAKAALGSETQSGNLSSQLERLTADDPDRSLKADQLVAYARHARVSLHWLITGEGLETDGPYGQPTREEMRDYPDALRRATKALMELNGVGVRVALWAADLVFERFGAVEHTPDDWLIALRAALMEHPGESGERPSVRHQQVASGK